MVNFKNRIICVFLTTSIYVNAQNKLEIEIVNLKNDKGVVCLTLFDSNNKLLVDRKATVSNKKCILIIDNLKSSKYAIKYYHDANSNNKFDTNMLGIPSEGYGISNNAYGNFGPQAFDKWLFEVKNDTKITLNTKN